MNSENQLLNLNVSKTRGSSRSQKTRSHIEPDGVPKTPPKKLTEIEQPKTPLSAVRNFETIMTPRRSVRKSIKPAQDYDEIVLNRRALRSHNGTLLLESEEHKWTPAKVGRVSQKRKGRSGKKTKNAKSGKKGEENVLTSEDSEEKTDESVNIGKDTENTTEDVLNTTFDMKEETEKDNDANIEGNFVNEPKEESCKVSHEPIEQKIEVQSKDTGVGEEVENSEAHKDTTEKEDVVKALNHNLIEESSQLGCTPIVYDENYEHEGYIVHVVKKEQKEDLRLTPKPTNSKTEKISEKPFNVEEEVIIEHSKKDNKCVKSEKVEVTIEGNDDGVESEQPVVYEPIEILSDDDMISLVLSDDEEMLNKDKIKLKEKESLSSECKGKVEKKESLNGTFDMSDCIVISPTDQKIDSENLSSSKKADPIIENISLAAAAEKVKELQGNYFSPINKPSAPAPKIVLSNDEDLHKTLLSTPKTVKNLRKIGTPVSGVKRLTPNLTKKAQNTGTPLISNKTAKRQPKPYRFPTPYKSKKDFCFGTKEKENDNHCGQPSPKVPPEVLTNLEPKEIVLRSIRKRSLSLTIDGDQRKRKALNVTFYSPANQTATIADLDDLLAKSAAKLPKSSNGSQRPDNVTLRKRSISLDDDYIRPKTSKLPRPVLNTPQKIRVATRTKLPNFAAIHKQQFQKMENLVDYVARKAERAQNLTNSALKARNVSAPSPASKKQKSTASKTLVLSTSNKVTSVENPQAIASISNKADFSHVEASKENASNKLKTRTQRHIEMFKARPVDSKSSTRKNVDIIRGVRSNRRFELMMQHRKTSGN